MMDIFDYSPWTPKNLDDLERGPCRGGCCASHAMDENCGYTTWTCNHGAWVLPKERMLSPVLNYHEADACPGNCQLHPLTTAEFLNLRREMDCAIGWGTAVCLDWEAAIAKESPAQRAARLAADAAHDAATQGRIENFSVTKKQSKWTDGGKMKFRVPRCCKYASLFEQHRCAKCECTVPAGQDTCCGQNGQRHLPEKLAGCWSHESTRTCIYIHPDEPQWEAACDGSLCYDRQVQQFYLKGDTAPSAPAPVIVGGRNLSALLEKPTAARRTGGRQEQQQAPVAQPQQLCGGFRGVAAGRQAAW
jgi:hypothetical protein